MCLPNDSWVCSFCSILYFASCLLWTRFLVNNQVNARSVCLPLCSLPAFYAAMRLCNIDRWVAPLYVDYSVNGYAQNNKTLLKYAKNHADWFSCFECVDNYSIVVWFSGLTFWATLYAWHSVVWFLSVKVARSWEACCSLGQVMDLVSAKRVLRRPVSIHWRPRRFPLWRHQLQASAARRAAWRGWGIQRVGRGVIAWSQCDLDARPRTAIDDCFSSAFWRSVHSWTRR